jgi:serine/threonine protein kinase
VLPTTRRSRRWPAAIRNLASRLAEAAHRYLSISASLDTGAIDIDSLRGGDRTRPAARLGDAPSDFEGFRTIERIGTGGMGDIYKLQDLTLDRTVAAKVIRRTGRAQGYGG